MITGIGHHGFGVIEPGHAGRKEETQDVAFLLETLRFLCGGLFDTPLLEVLLKGLIDVHKAVAVCPVRKRHCVGGIAVVVLDDPLGNDALAELRDPVGSAHGGILEAEKERASGGLEAGKPVCDIHLHRYRCTGVVHGEKVIEVIDPGVLAHVNMFA